MLTEEDKFHYCISWNMIGYLSGTSRDLPKAKRLVQSAEFQILYKLLNSDEKEKINGWWYKRYCNSDPAKNSERYFCFEGEHAPNWFPDSHNISIQNLTAFLIGPSMRPVGTKLILLAEWAPRPCHILTWKFINITELPSTDSWPFSHRLKSRRQQVLHRASQAYRPTPCTLFPS